MAQTFNTSLKNVATSYLKLLNVKVTESSVKQELEEHPYYPALFSLSDTFDNYNIENKAYKIAVENFKELEPPFIAYQNMPDTGNDFVLVTDITEKTVSYVHKSKKKKTLEKELFLKGFKEIIWAAEPNEHSGEADYSEKLKAQKAQHSKKNTWTLSAFGLLLISIIINQNSANSLPFSTIILFKLIGLATTILLLMYEVDKTNAFVKNICTAGRNTDCGAVLNSSAAKFLGISWSEIGFFYFASTTLFLLLPHIVFEEKIALLSIANALAVPYVFFSIYYQWRVVKQWCTMCLVTQCILLAELSLGIVQYWQHFTVPIFSIGLLLNTIACILLPIVLWYGLKPTLFKARDHNLYRAAYKRLQSNPDIFKSLLEKQPKATDGWEKLGITIGNPHASNTVIKVCNPYCGPCAKAHSRLENILKPDIQLRIIFTASNMQHDIAAATVVKHLLAIAEKGDANKTKQALDDWYLAETKNYDAFATKYPVDKELKLQDKKITAMHNWCTENDISATPTLFVNGYSLPENYSIEQLKIIL